MRYSILIMALLLAVPALAQEAEQAPPERIKQKIETHAKALAKDQPDKFFKSVVKYMDAEDTLTWIQERHVSEPGSYIHVVYETATDVYTYNVLVSGRRVKPEGWVRREKR